MHRIAAALSVLLLAGAAHAAPLSYPLTVRDGVLGGAGAGVLQDEIAKSQFILYGEDHGFADSPIVLRAIARDARPLGFTYHAVEVGPLSAALASDTLAHRGVAALHTIVHRNPLAFPFLSLKEDAELATDFAGHDAKGTPYLWGIDQEFVGAPVLLLQRLAEVAPNAAAKSEALRLLAVERKAADAADQSKFFLFTEQEKDFDALAALFAGSADGLKIVAGLRESAGIYQAFMQNKNYGSNARRSRLLVSTFLADYHAAADPQAKVIFKMGAEHTGLGMTPNNTFDPGTVASSIALANGKKALRILFLPAGGTHVTLSPAAGNPFHVEAYNDPDVKDFFAGIGVDPATLSKDGWSLIPLQPVRDALETEGIAKLKPMTRFFLLGYDYLITTPNAKAATPLY